MSTHKAWTASIIASIMSMLSVASQVDFTNINPNQIRDIIIAGLSAGIVAFGGTWAMPNKVVQSDK